MSEKILVVDDEKDILNITVFRLENAGYQVLSVVDGQSAMDIIRAERPDLVLLDLRVPVIDGYEVCKRVKADEDLRQIPVILFTANVSENMVEKTNELGADDFLLKPFNYKELLRKVSSAIKKQ